MKTSALLIGINNYKRLPLQGCVNDVRAMFEALTERHHIGPGDTYTLLDGQATRAGILQGLQWLAVEGPDVAIVLFSGHGTRVPDLDGDEARGWSGTKYDQAIVPVDYERNGLILDDDLAAVFWTFPRETKLIVILDSCYSAKAERGILAAGRNFFGRHVQRRVDRALPPRLIPRTIILESQARRAARRGVIPPRKMILLSGCRDFETASDARLGGTWRGAMSYHVEQAVQALGPDANYLQIVEEARRRLAADGFPQIPQLSGPSYWLHSPIFT